MPCPLQYPSQRTFDYKVDWPAIPYPRLFKLCAHVLIEIDLLELLFVFCPCSKLAQKLWTTQLMCPLCVGRLTLWMTEENEYETTEREMNEGDEWMVEENEYEMTEREMT